MFRYLDDDIVNLRREDGSEAQFYWGDKVEVLDETDGVKHVAVHGSRGEVARGIISAKTRLREDGILRLSMVDVQQGDGLVLETPGGRIVFIDGGDNQLFARHANARFSDTSEDDPLVVDLMLVTHGDADHFEGLSELRPSETDTRPGKRIFVAPRRVYHNGLVKRPREEAGRGRPRRPGHVRCDRREGRADLRGRSRRRPRRRRARRAEHEVRDLGRDAGGLGQARRARDGFRHRATPD